jgi:hypothetical protein
MKSNTCVSSYLTQFSLEWETSQAKSVEEMKIHISWWIIFRKSYHLWDNVEKYCRAGQAIDDNKHYMLNT